MHFVGWVSKQNSFLRCFSIALEHFVVTNLSKVGWISILNLLLEHKEHIIVTYFDEVGCISEWQLEGAVPRCETEGAGLVIALQVVVHRVGHHVHAAEGQHKDSTCNKDRVVFYQTIYK